MAAYRPLPEPVPQLLGRRSECDVLDRLIEAVRGGGSRALVVSGEPGVGKTALLDYLAERATGCRVAAAAGVQSEMELAFAGLHQLLAPMLDRLGRLPGPQREALRTAFGVSAGPAPDRLVVGLAVLGLLSEVAAAEPLVCLIDDQGWLDHGSAQVLAFVARRLGAEAVGLVFAARVPTDDVAGLPVLVVQGLRDDDARALLGSTLTGPLDERVRDQFVAETHGNPLALLELPRGLTAAELAGGFGLPGALPLPGRIEESFRRRVEALPDQALGLLVAAGAGPPDPLRAAQAEHLRGQIAFAQQRGTAVALLLGAARLLGPLNPSLACEAHLEALMAAIWAGDLARPGGVREAAEAALAAPPVADSPRAADVLLDALALRYTRGHAAAVPALTRALELLLALGSSPGEARRWLRLVGARGASGLSAVELWDFESWCALAAGQAQAARDTGAFVHLQFALNLLARVHLLAGELAAAAELLDEDRLIADATGNPPVTEAAMTLAAWRGQEREATALIEATAETAAARGVGRLADFADHASAVLYNGLGRHDAALDAARRVFERDQLGLGPFIVPELAEAASRTGDTALVGAALAWVSERTRVTPTPWALGIQARLTALLSRGQPAERLYRESIDHLGRTRLRTELARAHLLYGEWLRRQKRRVDAREQLHTAYQMLEAMGAGGFAERARRELVATGQSVRKRAPQADGAADNALTSQEAQVARLASEGLSNQEISTRLFISPRTVDYHLGQVFAKLGISKRAQLHRVLPGDPDAIQQR